MQNPLKNFGGPVSDVEMLASACIMNKIVGALFSISYCALRRTGQKQSQELGHKEGPFSLPFVVGRVRTKLALVKDKNTQNAHRFLLGFSFFGGG